jgi:UPF0042 nucleotide-binding protein
MYSVLPEGETLHVHVLSFGFKYGVPIEADVVMDVRFLSNPFFDLRLRDLDGTDQSVISFVLEQEQTRLFLEKFTDLIDYLLPRYREEGKSYLTLAIGCTGGRHRSVVIVEQLKARLIERRYSTTVEHRDIEMD